MMQMHALADIPPSMSEAQFAALRDDIKANGLLTPIVMFEGKVLDGRHRLRACQELGIDPRFEQYEGTEEQAASYVCSVNVARRHMNPAQLGICAAKLKGWFAERAKARQQAGLKNGAAPVQTNWSERGGGDQGNAREQAAKAVGVGSGTVHRAEVVLRDAVKEVVSKVEEGGMSLHEAFTVSSLPVDTQRRIASMPSKKERKVAAAKSAKKQNNTRDHRANADKTLVLSQDGCGTKLVRTVLSRLEVLCIEIDRSGLGWAQFAKQFVSEFDGGDESLVSRLSRVEPAMLAAAELALFCKKINEVSAK